MEYPAAKLDVMTVTESRKMVHRAHPTQATKPRPAHVESAMKDEDVLACVGKAQLTEDGVLFIQLKAVPIGGRLVIHLPK